MSQHKILVTFLLLCLSPVAAPAAPVRIVSANLCADQLLLQLAAPEHIAAVSHLSHDASLSYFVEEARLHTGTKGGIEEILALKPDLVILGPSAPGHATRQLLQSQGVRVEEITVPTTLSEVEQQIRNVAGWVDEQKKGNALIARMQAQILMTRLQSRELRGEARVAIYRNAGYSDGPGTLADDMIAKAGLRNYTPNAKTKGDSRIPLERLVSDPPDLLVIDAAGNEAPTLGKETLRHPALLAAINGRTLSVPVQLSICGNNLITKVAQAMVEALIEQRATNNFAALPTQKALSSSGLSRGSKAVDSVRVIRLRSSGQARG